jgi:hypothetical protein
MQQMVHSACTMRRSPTARSHRPRRGGYAVPGAAYLFFCAAVVVTIALLTFASIMLGPRDLHHVALPQTPLPVATIQLLADHTGACKRLKFHNDTGQFEDDGKGPCRNLIPADMLVETTGRRLELLARVFSFR